MFTEILRVKPVLDTGAGKQMEASLSERFKRVAAGFGGHLKSIIKGSVLGISLGLLNRILNPLEALDERIKNLLGQGTQLTDLADRFNTTPGKLKRLEDVAQSLGVQPEALKDLLTKFAEGVETATKELQNPFLERSAGTQTLQEAGIVNSKGILAQQDLAQSFLAFTHFLQTQKATGREAFFSNATQEEAARRQAAGESFSAEELANLERQGLAKRLNGDEAQRLLEEQVFGTAQFGAAKKFINADFAASALRVHEPGEQQINQAVKTAADAADLQNRLQVENNNKNFLRDSQQPLSQMVQLMEAATQREAERTTSELNTYKALQAGAQAADDIKNSIQNLLNLVTQVLGLLTQITQVLPKLTSASWWSTIFGGNR